MIPTISNMLTTMTLMTTLPSEAKTDLMTSMTTPSITIDPTMPIIEYKIEHRSRISGSVRPGIARSTLSIDMNDDHTNLHT